MNRQLSLPIVFEETDPYRIPRKNPGPTDSNSEVDVFHSRTASDSSTNKTCSTSLTLHDNYEDPYVYKKKKSDNCRANSYLPYSHHERDPNQKTDPIYIENTATATSMLHLGSLITAEPIINAINNKQAPNNNNMNNNSNNIPDLNNEENNRLKRYCGLRLRSLLFIIFLWVAIIVIIWYIVWPRIPDLSLQDIDNVGNIQVITNTTTKSISANWLLNLTADNSNNWVPTHLKSIDFTIQDDETNQLFGNGSITNITLPGRQQSSIYVPMSIYYASDNANDTTFQDLYNACGVQVTANSPFENQQDLLNVTFSITFYIYGIVWSTTEYLPYIGLSCPTN